MNDLLTLVETFDKEESDHFVQFLKQRNKRNDSKNVRLYTLLRLNKYTNEQICTKLYPSSNKIAYNALRKRLFESLVDYIALTSFNTSHQLEQKLIKLVIAARKLCFNRQFKLALKVLIKAERLADQYQFYSILAEVYHTQVQYIQFFDSLNLDQLSQKVIGNLKQYQNQELINLVYASIKWSISKSNDGKAINYSQIYTNAFKAHHIDQTGLSYKSLYQLISIVSFSAHMDRNFHSVEHFLEFSYGQVKTSRVRDSEFYYQVQITYILANVYFRTRQFQKAFDFLDFMLELITQKKGKYYHEFISKHQKLLALCFHFTNQIEKAISISLTQIKQINSETETQLDLKLGLCMFYFHAKEFKLAHRTMSQLSQSDKWYVKKTDRQWLVNKKLIELLIHIELDHLMLVQSRLLSFKRSYFEYLKSVEQFLLIDYVNYLELYYVQYNKNLPDKYLLKIQKVLTSLNPIKEDVFLLCYYYWLEAKLSGEDSYTLTLKSLG